VQWWGLNSHLDKLANRPNEVILSNYDQTYLDVGFGNRNGRTYQTYIRWRDLYKFNPRYEKVNVIGGEVCMWSELSNQHNHDQKVWTRTSVLAERLWNEKISLADSLRDIATRLVAQTRRLKRRGFKTSAVTVQLCENSPEVCF
jgi:hexosaminidase